MISFIKRTLAGLVLAFALVYAADFGWIEYKVSSTTEAFDTIPIQRYYAVKEKDGKTEFMFDKPANEPCVNSLFPHWGHAPCWYLKRHTRKRVDM